MNNSIEDEYSEEEIEYDSGDDELDHLSDEERWAKIGEMLKMVSPDFLNKEDSQSLAQLLREKLPETDLTDHPFFAVY